MEYTTHHLNNSNVAINAINKILRQLNFDRMTEEVLIMGDHNELYKDFKIKTMKVKDIELKLKQLT